MLFGGAVDNCELTGLDTYNSGKVFDMLVQMIQPQAFLLTHFAYVYVKTTIQTTIIQSRHSGETFQVSVAAVGQRSGIVPAAVGSRMDRGRLSTSQYVQQTTKTCTMLTYTVFSKEDVHACP